MNKNKKPKILIFDIETSPLLSWNWGTYEQDAISVKDDWFILCFSAKWYGEKKVINVKLNDFKMFKKDKQNDYEVCKELHKLFDEADILISHNGNKFDIKKTNARFIQHGFLPPSSYKSIDTLNICRKYFKFTSNKLTNLGKQFKIGEKVKHEGINLWFNCMNGDVKSWRKMKKYNNQDVILLEKLYLKLLPWITNHPNYNIYNQTQYNCPNCGSGHIHRKGYAVTKTQIYQRWQCQNCGSWGQSTKSEKINKPMLKN